MKITMNNEHYLHNVGDDDLEAADDHGLGGGDPADRLGHEDAAEDAEDGLLEAEQPGHPGPAAEQSLGVQTGHARHGDGEAANREPEHEDGVVEVAQLPRDDRHPGRQQRHRQREAQPHQVVRRLGLHGPRVPGPGRRHVGGVGGVGAGAGVGEEGGGPRDDDHAAQQTRADQGPGAARVTCHSRLWSAHRYTPQWSFSRRVESSSVTAGVEKKMAVQSPMGSRWTASKMESSRRPPTTAWAASLQRVARSGVARRLEPDPRTSGTIIALWGRGERLGRLGVSSPGTRSAPAASARSSR